MKVPPGPQPWWWGFGLEKSKASLIILKISMKKGQSFFGTKMLLYSSCLSLFDFETYNFHNTSPVTISPGGYIPERGAGNEQE